ncbi:MAG: endonuclease III domain-containing protein [Planctomycetota bacterium]|jgi:endonuclease-3 related protein
MNTGEKLIEIYRLLLDHFGHQHWWPGETKFEIIVGAILTQNTNWGNVEKAIANLKSKDYLTAEKLYSLNINELASLIRPAGYYNLKSKRLKNFLNWLFDNYDGALTNLEGAGTVQLREELLAIRGIGPETADSILLYAFERDVFVVDAYTARIMTRHQMIEYGADYEQIQCLFESSLEANTKMFNEYHALLVKVGKEFCRPTAKCIECPLRELPYNLDIENF